MKAIIAAVSREYGLEYLEVYRYSVNKYKFRFFLHNLRRKYPFDDILLVMD